MLRAGRFRHRLLDDAFLKNSSPLAFECLQSFLPLWRQGQLSDMEMAGIYILIFSFLRRPKDFLGGAHNQPMAKSSSRALVSGREIISRLRESLPADLQGARSLDRLATEEDFLTHFCRLSWRSIPLSAPVSLAAWHSGAYPLQLMTSLPSPDEVLRMQSQGIRCVSMLIQKEELESFVAEGRDVLGFIIHDLIHADHFFSDPEKAVAQIHFSQKLLLILGLSSIQEMLEKDTVFRDEFHYLMSDMNSVPLHLLKTLKAVLLGYFKRREKLPLTAPLPLRIEAEFNSLFETVLEPWGFHEKALKAAHRLNTPQYKGLEDAALLHETLTTNYYAESHIFC